MCVKCQSLTPCVVHFIHILLRMLVKDVSDKEWNFGGLETLITENITLTPVTVLIHVRVVVDGTVITMYTLLTAYCYKPCHVMKSGII